MRKIMRNILKYIFIKIPFYILVVSVSVVFLMKWIPVSYTPLMLKRALEYKDDVNYVRQRVWVPIEDVSENTIKAVLAAEDSGFFLHNGFEVGDIFTELERMMKGAKNIRGCSTISQQTAKNVFTLGSSTWLRKGVEAYYTFLIEKIWGKRRILEVYLNVAEMGKGIYGIGAASEVYFHKDARDVTLAEAASLAVCLPNPLTRSPHRMEEGFSKSRSRIMREAKNITF